MLESLRIRSFRYQWGADLFATWAAEMETLLLGWYVLVDTGSPFLVGLVGALRFGGLLLAPLYGVVADQVDRRRLLLALRVAQGAQAAAFAALAFSGSLQPWHAFALSGLGGLVRNGENVVRQSLIADSVPQGALLNAMGLSRTTMDGAKMAGTLAGRRSSRAWGWGSVPGGDRLLPAQRGALAADQAGAPAGAGQWRAGGAGRTAGALADLRSGVAYMRLSPTIVAIMFLAFLVNLTVFPLTNGLMPVVARDVFGGGPEVLALLLSTAAVGALAGSLALVALPRVRRPERIMLLSIVSWHLLLLAFAGAGRGGRATAGGGRRGGARDGPGAAGAAGLRGEHQRVDGDHVRGAAEHGRGGVPGAGDGGADDGGLRAAAWAPPGGLAERAGGRAERAGAAGAVRPGPRRGRRLALALGAAGPGAAPGAGQGLTRPGLRPGPTARHGLTRGLPALYSTVKLISEVVK